MKPAFLLLTAALTLISSAALAQNDVCTNSYGACMERCGSKSAPESCTQTCETTSNQCYDNLYRASAQNTGGAPKSEADDAHNEAEPKATVKKKKHR